MSYVKTTWVTGDIVTAPKLNNLESGVEANDLNKLNKPSGNGTAGQLLISNGDGSTSWTDTDTTLEESGKAADAKAVGDALGEINEALSTKAEIDGYYEEMTVGDAEQLVSTVYVEESTPYLYRTTGGSADVGNREYLDKIVGGSLAWNQLMDMTTMTKSGVTVTKNDDGSETLSGTTTAAEVSYYYYTMLANHKYLIKEYSSANEWAVRYGSYFRTSVTKNGEYRIVAPNSTSGGYAGIHFQDVGTTINATVCYQCIDLTLAFGTTIADYAYSLETAEAGTGVAWLKQYIDLDTYHPYDAGTLKHVEDLQSHDTVGFNQWDEEWELGSLNGGTGLPVASDLFIRSKNFDKCFPGMAYYLYCGFGTNKMNVFWYDANQDFISVTTIKNEVATSPSNAHYFKIRSEQSYGNIYRNDTCINLSWSGYRNGEYEPYEKHSYALDSSVVLRGIPKLVDGQMAYDGDEYLYDGTLNRRYKIVDLGTVGWYKNAPSYDISFSDATNMGAYTSIEAGLKCRLFSNYQYKGANVGWADMADKTFGIANKILRIRDDSYSTAADFKAAMSGIYFIYELATPTTETADPYTQVQICDDFGTEQFVTTSIIPVGTATRYPANLRDKLQHLPSLAENDGTYLIQQTNKEMSLIPFSGYVTEESLSETLEDYAVVDGYYEGMTVGNAEELVTGLTEEENVPFIFRTSGGSLEIGAREEMTVTGGSLAWNQKIPDFTSENASRFSYLQASSHTIANEIISIVPNGNYSSTLHYGLGTVLTLVGGHKYFVSFKVRSTKADKFRGRISNAFIWTGDISANTWGETSSIVNATNGADHATIYAYDDTLYTTSDTIDFKEWNLVDLTQMFGTTIADYIYNLEQTTAGAGVAWFKKLFPKDYYPYQEAGLVHVNASEFKTVGFNQWDEEWELGTIRFSDGLKASDDTRIRSKNNIPVLPNAVYYAKDPTNGNNMQAYFYDANGNYIGGKAWFMGEFTTPSNVAYMLFVMATSYGTTYKNDICISIHWDNTRNGEYEPYTEHSYPLDSSLVLRGIPKIDTDGNLYYDGDTYEADGTVTRRYGIVDMGTLNWSPNSGDQHQFYAPLPERALIQNYNCINTKYQWGYAYNGVDKTIEARTTLLWICDSSYETSTALKNDLNGVYLVYLLETSTTETATPYQTPQIVDNWGTEQFTVTEQNGVEVPVGHSTIYPISLRDKLEAAPDLPADDGDYILRMSGNEASYARLASEFPTPPTTDGNYVLKATATNGTATLTWEAQS